MGLILGMVKTNSALFDSVLELHSRAKFETSHGEVGYCQAITGLSCEGGGAV